MRFLFGLVLWVGVASATHLPGFPSKLAGSLHETVLSQAAFEFKSDDPASCYSRSVGGTQFDDCTLKNASATFTDSAGKVHEFVFHSVKSIRDFLRSTSDTRRQFRFRGIRKAGSTSEVWLVLVELDSKPGDYTGFLEVAPFEMRASLKARPKP